MASNNVRSLRGRKPPHKSPNGEEPILTSKEEPNSLSLSSTSLINISIILEVIPYPVALWSLDHRSCMFNHPARQLFGFSEDEFLKSGSLWTDRIHPQDRDVFLAAWRRLQAGERRVACRYRFLPKNEARALCLRELS